MTRFSGFPRGGRGVPVPMAFLAEVVPEIADLAELKVSLHVLWRLTERREYPRFVSRPELETDRLLIHSLSASGPPLQELRRGLRLAVERATFLEITIGQAEREDQVYFLNSEADRLAIERMERGEIQLGQLAVRRTPAAPSGPRPNVFALYEQNIGLLTPMIADELRAAERDYPAGWIEDAFRAAVAANRRNWRYISRILERWHAEGKDDGITRQDPTRDSWDRLIRPERAARPRKR